ncbi:MBL fold metallo-hydrolase [Fusibacter paucivorans]|uniref:MBL fold metallo-hydrolase n=1 Tax=Fusibacter paucivorans TaxID=76009 RepID=A0ABS5PPN7_9FIRM|nr:MBL fold metallo-hydrolase [Fusibacter paucivorans]MBS7527138.1 MBL fold metallo-hydrolase [Fusibacter paucivorans]
MAIHVTLLANEGILLQCGNTKLLIDGIHVKEHADFSGLSENVLKDLLAGEKTAYQAIQYVLFTHHHEDHFSPEKTEAFLRNHKIKGFFLPEKQMLKNPSLSEIASQQAETVYPLSLALGEKITITLTDTLSITVFCTIHAGEAYKEIENYCYLIHFSGKSVLIVGDSDYNPQYFKEMLSGEMIDTLFVNPMFVRLVSGRKVVEAINPQQLIVYHIPFEADDQLQFRRMVPKDIERHQTKLPPIQILWDELQEIIL